MKLHIRTPLDMQTDALSYLSDSKSMPGFQILMSITNV